MVNGGAERPSGEPCDLRQETYALLEIIRKPTAEEQKALEDEGFVFLTIEAKSLDDVLAENGKYFGHVHPSKNLGIYTPPQPFVVAVNPKELCIAESNNCSQEEQLRRIEQYSQQEIETKFLGAKAIMLPATGCVQLDIEFQKRSKGKLLKGYQARVLDTASSIIDTSLVLAASVGRDGHNDPLSVYVRDASCGDPKIWAISVVVFLQQK